MQEFELYTKNAHNIRNVSIYGEPSLKALVFMTLLLEFKTNVYLILTKGKKMLLSSLLLCLLM